MYFEIDDFCEGCKESKSGICFAEVYSVKMFRGSVFREKSLSRLVGVLYLHIFLIKMHEIDTATEVYLSPLRSKSMDWFLYDNGLRHERVKTLSNIYD